MADLTERLAAKLVEARVRNPHSTSEQARVILPLLLSEPELVAGLPEAVRLGVLNKRELAVMRHGEAVYAHNVLLRERWNDFDALEKSDEEIRSSLRALQVLAHDAALAEARALAPEVPRG